MVQCVLICLKISQFMNLINFNEFIKLPKIFQTLALIAVDLVAII